MRNAFLGFYGGTCAWCAIYWLFKRTPNGGWAILTPAAFVWIVQLGCVSLVWVERMSLLNLLWLVPSALIAYFIIGRVLYQTGVFRSGL